MPVTVLRIELLQAFDVDCVVLFHKIAGGLGHARQLNSGTFDADAPDVGFRGQRPVPAADTKPRGELECAGKPQAPLDSPWFIPGKHDVIELGLAEMVHCSDVVSELNAIFDEAFSVLYEDPLFPGTGQNDFLHTPGNEGKIFPPSHHVLHGLSAA
eukprot:CAMPEP_0118971614 /NCGR_PEP_ID=MMETSP1173-20130426/8185_1 /TAXON_ID=1034831 /ORGANISM="Rhizochromulina marina cf, Strain CCMP1243" /LENGTH=155 /DNA_ID=CAMNT_0006921081 /DNA_START=310 /DNA_END=777 /DNA_ORIENTATION=+